jgi:hypothetical protein
MTDTTPAEEVKRIIASQRELAELARELGLDGDNWSGLDDLDLDGDVDGGAFGEFVGGCENELRLTLWRDGGYVAEVLVADLLIWATGIRAATNG